MAYVSKIKDTNENILDIKSKITSAIPYGECDSTSTATVFTATVDGITALYDGVCCLLKNGVKTSASGFTININGLGAKPVYSNLATGNDITPTAPTRDTTIFNINYTMFLIYSTTLVEGGAWICYRGYDSNSNDTGYYIRHSYATLPVSDTARYYKLYFTSADNTKWVPSSVHSANNATAARPVNQRPINPFGKIVYTSASTNYTAGSNLAVGSAWEQYPFTLGYAFNRTGAALTLTYPAPVYIKCAPQADGSAIIDEDVPYVQALPTSVDGKIYIFLGIAYAATTVELYQDHPVYYHDGISIKLWPGTMILGEEPFYSENNTPYKFRQIETDGLANKELLEKIVGGSLAWNQLIDPVESKTIAGVSLTSTNGKFTLSGTATTNGGRTGNWSKELVNLINGHKYLNLFTLDTTNMPVILTLTTDSNTMVYVTSRKVFTTTVTGSYWAGVNLSVGVAYNTSGYWQIFDLTQMFGATIADYIYNLETATTGAGVAWFKKYFPNDYYPYQEPDLVHVESLQSHDTVGFNQWDEQWEIGDIDGITGEAKTGSYLISKNYIEVVPATSYCISSQNEQGTSAREWVVYLYDANKQIITYYSAMPNLVQEFNVPSNCHYIKFRNNKVTTTYDHDICISIHRDDTRNSEYEPYTKHSYSLDSSVMLRGIPKIDTDGNLYYDGDTYEADGMVTRKYGIVDLGTLTWNKNGTASPQQAYATLSIAGINDQPGHNIVSSKYVGGSAYNSADKTICIYGLNGTRIWLADSALDGFTATEIKAALSGVYAVYELATPTIETATPYQRIQDIDNWGTQEFVTTSIVPVGHLTRYPKNLIALTEQISDTISVSPTTTTPIMDGTASVGTEREYARGDHIHPTDTTRQATLVSGTNIKTINNTSLLGSGNISTPNTTYAAATTGAAGLMSSTDKAKLDSIASSATRNTFSAITGGPTGNQTPGFGSTFNIYQVGQTTAGAITTTARTVTIPNSTATTAAAGLMPKISGSTAQMLNGAGSWVNIPASYWVYNSTNDTIELVFPS